ncbi:MAG TPA: class I SAM-dependent methyltransferase [Steroidobacteraceae bacterium]
MQAGQPSRTALMVAIQRAAHQVLEGGVIFADPLAMRILGAEGDKLVKELKDDPFSRALRQYVVVRARIAEDALVSAVERGTRQLVILGAGLDTTAYRVAPGVRLRVFEVDFPATQEWKRSMLAAAGIALPKTLVFAPVDFEHQTLAEGLAAAGVDRTLPTFFSWLGVVPYLTPEAFAATLSYIAAWQSRTQVVFDYANAPESLSGEGRNMHEGFAARVAAAGEPFRNFLDTEDLHRQLQALGFTIVEDLGMKQIAARFAPEQVPHMQERGGHILRAVTAGP